MENKEFRGHVLTIPFPSQGHINPLLQFSKHLASKGLKTTLATTVFISNTFKPRSPPSVQLDTISDGYDDGGFAQAESVAAYLTRLEAAGSKTLADLILKYKDTPNPIDCIVYDSFLPWALVVAKQFGIATAAFFTQSCTVNYIYYCVQQGLLKLPIPSLTISVLGLQFLELGDMPSFISVQGSYPAYFEMVLNQFDNAHQADFMLMSSVYGFEEEVVESMKKVCPTMLTIGPTVPSGYLDKRVKDDLEYEFSLFSSEDACGCMDWLNKKPAGSVVYVSFGSMADLSVKQMQEIAMGLKGSTSNSSYNFLWVVRASEHQKLPDNFVEETKNQGLVVKWSNQLEVLSNEAVGCFLTHCGWNSTVEALSLGVPMVCMPQWTDQITNAKLVEDVWKVGVRVTQLVDDDDNVNGIVPSENIKSSISEVMEGERARNIKKSATKWRNVAIEAITEGGTSDDNIEEFVLKLKS